MVRTKRLELLSLAAPEPKSGVSTNFTTPALTLIVACILHKKFFKSSKIHNANKIIVFFEYI